MTPIRSKLTVGHIDIIIKDFVKKHERARFFSKSKVIRRLSMVEDAGHLKTTIILLQSGLIEVTLRRVQLDTWELFPIYLGGKIHLLESDISSSFEAVKFCGYRSLQNTDTRWTTKKCVCADYSGMKVPLDGFPKCKFGGDEAFMRQYLKVGNDIPEQATIRIELKFLPLDYNPETIQDDDTSDLKRDMAALRKNIETADVKLICNGKLFMAHKAVLSARSDVFAALFRHKGTKEDVSGQIHIEDCDHEAMEMFLSFIYEDKAPPQDVPFEVAKQLMNVANKYNVQSLVKKGIRCMLACLNEENAIQMAVLGKLYNMDALQKAAKRVIAASEKSLVEMVEVSGLRLQDREN